MNLENMIVSTYEAARERGASRCDAFCRAIEAYRRERPDLPANRAGTEVARMLLAAAQNAQASTRNGLPAKEQMEYVEPV